MQINTVAAERAPRLGRPVVWFPLSPRSVGRLTRYIPLTQIEAGSKVQCDKASERSFIKLVFTSNEAENAHFCLNCIRFTIKLQRVNVNRGRDLHERTNVSDSFAFVRHSHMPRLLSPDTELSFEMTLDLYVREDF